MVGENSRSLTVAAADGRTLMVAQWGDLNGFEGMDPLNVREFAWALEGEEVLAREYEREAAEMLERVAADPSKVLGEDWRLPEADRAQLAKSERHEVVRQMITEALRNGVW